MIGPPVMTSVLEDHEQVRVKFQDVVVDEKENSRIFYNETDILSLAEDISIHGLLYPLIVSKRKDERYDLKAGFRRHRALTYLRQVAHERNHKKLPFENLTVKIIELEGFELDMFNFVDNHNQQLTVIEIGRFVQKLREKHRVDVKLIAKRSGRSVSYIYHCTAVADNCAPEIIRALERGLENHTLTDGSNLSTRLLFHWSTLSREKQLEAFQKWTGTELQELENRPRRSLQTVNPSRIRSYLARVQDAAASRPEILPIARTLEWVLKQRTHPPIRLSVPRKPQARKFQ